MTELTDYLDPEGFIDIPAIQNDDLLGELFPGLLPEVEDIRKKDFPQLVEQGRAYLDNGATTQEPISVIQEFSDWRIARIRGSNHSRWSQEAIDAQTDFDASKTTLRNYLGAQNYHIAITSGTTESSNLVATRFDYQPGDLLVVSFMEHNSQIITARNFAKRAGVEVAYMPSTPEGKLDLAGLQEIIETTEHDRLFMNLVHVSNVTGATNPVKEIREMLGEEAIIYLDMAQSAAHMPIDLDDLGVDFAGLSAHKMYGPFGLGALLVKQGSEKYLNNLVLGGGAVDFVTPDLELPVGEPERFELGTKNLEGAHEWALSLDWISKIGINRIQAHEKELGKYFASELTKIDGVQILGYDEARSASIITFNVGGHGRMMHGRVAQKLDSDGTIVRNGCFCAHVYTAALTDTEQYGRERLEEYLHDYVPGPADNVVPGGVRLAFAPYNTMEEAYNTVQKVREIADMMMNTPVDVNMAWIAHVNEQEKLFRDPIDPRDIELDARTPGNGAAHYSHLALHPITLKDEGFEVGDKTFDQFGLAGEAFEAFSSGFSGKKNPNGKMYHYQSGIAMADRYVNNA